MATALREPPAPPRGAPARAAASAPGARRRGRPLAAASPAGPLLLAAAAAALALWARWPPWAPAAALGGPPWAPAAAWPPLGGGGPRAAPGGGPPRQPAGAVGLPAAVVRPPADGPGLLAARRRLQQTGRKAELVARLRGAAAQEGDGLDTLRVDELKVRLKRLGLRQTGRKAELVARLRGAAAAAVEEVDEVKEEEEEVEEEEGDGLDTLRVDELKVRLKRLGLQQAGMKAELVARLRGALAAAAEQEKDEGEGAKEQLNEEEKEEEEEVPRTGGGSGWLKKGADVDVKHNGRWYTSRVLDIEKGWRARDGALL
ncbi:unnamed protein product [Prorocentrum cordatum]|uniref:SAP domain-containing protein n=1 Tax=Prorocentrum cordatum TaxID=2364126 RepID=A0ABN9XQB6_9DINO|nr:unnamed protein product [Polarella glacialis]